MATSIRSTGVLFNNSSTQRRAFPNNGIIMWYGNIANIPAGWRLCDGTNGSRDLRNRFIVGAGLSYPVGSTGGSDASTLNTNHLPPHTHTTIATTSSEGSHSHEVDVETAGSHSHTYSPSSVWGSSGPFPFGVGPVNIGPADVGPAGSHNHTAPATASSGSHSHTVSVTINPAGGAEPHENRPPYYALVFLEQDV